MSVRPPTTRVRGEFQAGDRVLTGGRRGVVQFHGLVDFATGKYVGIELDTPEGKHDGSMKGKRYFTCAPNHGVFVKPSMVTLDTEAAASASPSPAPASAASSSSSSAIPASSPITSRTTSRRPSDGDAAPVAASAVAATPIKAPTTAAAEHKIPESKLATPHKVSHLPTPGGSKLPHAASSHPASSPQASPHTAASSTAASSASSSAQSSPVAPRTQSATPLASPASSPQVSPSAPAALSIASPSVADTRLQASFEALQQAHAKLTQEHAQLMTSMQQTQASAQQHATEIARLHSDLSLRDRQLAELRTEVQAHGAQKSDDQIESLQNMIEMLTLDKSLAEEQYESCQTELSSLKNRWENQELEYTIVKEQCGLLQLQLQQLQTASSSSAPQGGGTLLTSDNIGSTNEANTKLLEQNTLLTDALRKLRDLNLSEKQSFTARINELEKQNQTLQNAENENVTLREQVQTLNSFVASLKEQLDEALELQTMVENLSQSKLDLEENVSNAKGTIEYLQSLVKASEEVEEGYKELHQQLQTEIENKEYNFIDLNQRYKLKNIQIDDLQSTNRKFRELVRTLESENATLKAKSAEDAAVSNGTAKSSSDASSTSNSGASSSLISTRASSLLNLRLKQVRVSYLDKLLTSLDYTLLTKRYEFIQLYLPSNVSPDDRSLNFLQMLDRLKEKSKVLATIWGQFYGGMSGNENQQSVSGGDENNNSIVPAGHVVGKIQVDYSSNTTNPELSLLSYQACLLLISLQHGIENLIASLYSLNLDAYNALCIRSINELFPIESILDIYIQMHMNDTFNELTSLYSLIQANYIIYSFLIEKIPISTRAMIGSNTATLTVQQYNVLPYQMAFACVLKKVGNNVKEEEAKWSELTQAYKQRAAKSTPVAPVASASQPILPSLSTFALTLNYSTLLSQTYSQLIQDLLDHLCETLKKTRARKRFEAGITTEAGAPSPTNADVAPTPEEEGGEDLNKDIDQYHSVWNDISDAIRNNASLSTQFQHSTVRNYINSLGVGSQEHRSEHDTNVCNALAAHICTIDQLAERTNLELIELYQAIRALIQGDQFNEIINSISLQSDMTVSHTNLQQLLDVLKKAKKGVQAASDASDSPLFGSLTTLRSELYITSKKVLSLTEENSQAAAANGNPVSPSHANSGEADPATTSALLTRARHIRTTSFLLTPSDETIHNTMNAATSSADGVNAATSTTTSATQPGALLTPWLHHPLTIRSQLSATAALRQALSDLNAKLQQQQKDLFASQKLINEERAKQEVLKQQLTYYTSKSTQYAEYQTQNDNLKLRIEEYEKQLNIIKLEQEKIIKENRALRKQMLKLKSQYLKEEQMRTHAATASAAVTGTSVGGSAVGIGGSSGGAVGSYSNVSSTNLNEIFSEIELMRRALAAQREELASLRMKQQLAELNVLLPPLDIDVTSIPPVLNTYHQKLIAPEVPRIQSKLVTPIALRSNNPYVTSFESTVTTAAASKPIADPTQEFRLIKSKLSELANEVWEKRVAPRVVKLEGRTQVFESKGGVDDDEKKSLSPSPSPYEQYVSEQVQVGQIQQCCEKLNQRVNRIVDQQRLQLWSA